MGFGLPLSVSSRRGRNLEVWTDDGDVTANPVNASELQRRADERAAAKAREEKGDDDGFDLADFGLGFLGVQGLGVLVVGAVVVVVLYQVAKSWNGALPSPGVSL